MALIENRISQNTFSLRSLSNALSTRLNLWRTRRALARLDAHLLKDIGLTPDQARREVDLAIWDVPANWTNR